MEPATTLKNEMHQTSPYSNLSIALCTFNGATFLASQLQSLVDQDQLPSELIIQDDFSTDSTSQILGDFISRAPFQVKLQYNPYTIGFAQNFARAIHRCQSEIIALCDQDDVWIPKKIARITDIFQNPEVGLVFSNAELVDEKMQTIGYSMWESIKFKNKEIKLMLNKQETAVLLKHYIVTGATLAFRSKFKPLILPIPQNWNHDTWIALLISSISRVWPLPEKLVLYRQHSSNAIGGIKRNIITQIRQALTIDRQQYYEIELARYQQLYQRLISHPEFRPRQEALRQIEAKLQHLETRACLPANRLKRLPKIFREIYSNGYSRFARNWGSIALDLFIQ